jgi:protein-S-isoprenylcysteine O-methyltransferase Ste14
MNFIFIIFLISLFVNFLIIGGLIFSILAPKYRIWPSPSKKSWQFWIFNTLIILSYAGVLSLSILDWDSFILKHWIRLPFGLLLIGLGFFIFFWGVRTLSVHSTVGLKGELIIAGPYKFIRNPQYVGHIFLAVGFIILSNSLYTLIVGSLGIVWNLILPFSEEPWLKEQYGEEYERYCQSVRRFF